MGALTAVMLFVSVLLHELGHSVVARQYGVGVRSITLFVFGGLAQITGEPPSAVAEFWIAIAGPLVSFALALLFRILQPAAAVAAPLLALVKYLAYINGALAIFNLIPGFPLDGGRVLRAVVWQVTGSLRRATLIAANVGRLIAFLFILGGVFQILAGHFVDGLWIAFVGWFLESAAASQVQQQMLQSLLAGHKVFQAMNRNYAAVSPDLTLRDLADRHILGSGLRSFVVTQNEHVVGLSTLHQIKEVPQDQWGTTTVSRIMIPTERVRRVQPEADLITAIEQMDRDGVNQLPVMTGQRILGMLTREDIIAYLRTLHELAA
jgi:Zn-dependent protease